MNNWDQYQSTPKLLPPTVFEKTNNSENNNNNINNTSVAFSANNSTLISSNNNLNDSYLATVAIPVNESNNQLNSLSNELEKLKLEIRKLHNENESLRHKNRDFVEQAQLYTEATGHRQISITALEEIILKQTREIQTLKCDLLSEREANRIKVNQLEEKYKHTINDLETERQLSNELHRKKIEKLESDRDSIANEQNSRIKQLIAEKTKLCDEYNSELNDLRTRFDAFNTENVKELNDKDSEIKRLQDENTRYLTELENLRRYVNDSMPTIETVKEMKKERKLIDDELIKSKSRNDSLIKENNALQIRLKSISEILTIQENQLESSNIKLGNNEKKRLGLLNKWRNKVFELLVQLKTLDIDYKQDKNKESRVVQDYNNKLDEQINKNKILENVIEDKKAELTVLNNDNSMLNEQLSALKEANKELERKHEQDLQSTIELKNFVDSLLKQYQTIEDSFKIANRKLLHLDQRVEFAKNRLGVIQALNQRKETQMKEELRRANLLDMTSNLSSIHGSLGVHLHHHESNLHNNILESQPQHSSLDPNQLLKLHQQHQSHNQPDIETIQLMRQELNRVVQERDMLANKLKIDVEEMDQRICKTKTEYESIIMNLNNQLKDLRETNEMNHQEIEQTNRELSEKAALYEDINKKYQDLELQLNELQTKLTEECQSKLKECELEFVEKMTKMDEKLNEARREQAKAVVLMRQMERSTNREKERMDSMLKSCESYYKDHIEKLKTKIVSLEKEKNILMSSLRQNSTNNEASMNLNNQMIQKTSNIKINKWLETNNLVELSTTTSSSTQSSLIKKFADLNNKEKSNKLTSFWFDNSEKNELKVTNDENKLGEDRHRQERILENENDEKIYDENEEQEYFDTSKNTEILNQIRKIMGNLELSDLDDNDSENKLAYTSDINDNKNQDSNVIQTKQDEETTEQSINASDLKIELNLKDLNYESEHAIDELLNYRKDYLNHEDEN